MKQTRRSLLTSLLALLLCFSMLLGTTFAWFTDEVTSEGNVIKTGTLDVEMYWSADGENWQNTEGKDAPPAFDYDNWEPGYTEIRYIKVVNAGDLAFKYLMNIIPTGEVGRLAEVIDVGYDVVSGNDNFVAPSAAEKAGSLKPLGTLKAIVTDHTAVTSGVLLPTNNSAQGMLSGEVIVCISMHMQESAGDEYQGTDIGDAFDIQLLAAQYHYESDSFDENYDKDTDFPVSATVLTGAAKTEYFVGDTLDTTGLVLKVNYHNGTSKELTTGFAVSSVDMSVAGSKTVRVSYTESGRTVSASYTVSVKEILPTGESVLTAPNKLVYFVNDTFDATGLALTVKYNDGSEKVVTLDNGLSIAAVDMSTAGVKSVRVVYVENGQEIVASFDVTVNEILVSGMEIKSEPTKKNYFVGDTLDTAGMELTITYNNGTTETVTTGYTVNVSELTTAGAIVVTVTYGSFTDTFEVSVAAVEATGMEIKTEPAKKDYFVGDTLDTTGMELTITYNNGTTETVTTGYTVNVSELTTTGTVVVTVTYGNFTDTFEVSVAAVEATGMVIKTEPAKKNYFVGDTLDTAGMELTITYNNGTTETVTTGYTVNVSELTTAGTIVVTVTYGNFTDTFEVSVAAVEATGMEIKTEPAKKDYFVGDTLDTTGMELTITYNNGTTETVTTGYTVSVSELTIAGAIVVTVTYGNFTDTFEVTVEEVEEPTAEFIYRVGNGNAVDASVLSAMLTGSAENANVIAVAEAANYSRSRSATGASAALVNGKYQFSGTGIVTVTIDGKDYLLEVVDAMNTTTGNIRNSGLLNGTNFVLLCDVAYTETQTVTMNGSTIYGNGFKFDFSNFEPQESELGNVFVIRMNSATLDNVQLIGKTYTEGAYIYKEDSSSDPASYMSLLCATGDSYILNSYVSGTRAPVRAEGNVTITNSTIAGGNVANIDVKGGVLNLNDVTLINQDTNVVGFGILLDNDTGVDEDGNPRPVTINVNGLTAYNWLTADDVANMTDTKYMQEILTNILDAKGTDSVNFAIVCLSDNENITINGVNVESATIGSNNGMLWGDSTTKEQEIPEYAPNANGSTPPVIEWKSYSSTIEYVAGGSVVFDADLVSASKHGEALEVTLSCTGGTVSGKSITFNTAGTYTVTYVITDTNNYRYNPDGELEQYTEIYTETITVNVIETLPETKHATIKIAGSETTVVEKDGKKYLVAKDLGSYTDASKTDNSFGFKYPELATLMSDGINGEHSSGYKACYPIFQAVEIIDYADGGTGAAITYNSATTTLPANLKYVKDRDGTGLKYQSGSNGDTTKGTVYQSLLCFTSPNTTKSRNEHFTWIEYSYTDNAGETYYWVIGYRAQAQTYKSCVTADTMVMLADGTQKRIDQVTYDDQLLVWNFFTGDYDVVPAAIIYYHGDANYRILNLHFADGTTVKVINDHGFFDMERNEFVFIYEDNVEEFIGDHFAKVDGDTRTAVELVGYSITEEYTGCYSIETAMYKNFMTEGMFSLTIPYFEGWFDYFEIGENMKYDEEKMQADIEKYGLYTYDDFKEYVTYEQFIAFNGPYLKVLVGRGVVTFDQILYLIDTILYGD